MEFTFQIIEKEGNNEGYANFSDLAKPEGSRLESVVVPTPG